MKAVLACMMCVVLNASQCFAIKGGPNYGTAQVRTTGTYAGLFVPSASDNSLGIFTLSVPKNGLGKGAVAFFRNGIFYPGTIQGIADPDSAILTAVVSSTFDITFTSETDPTTHDTTRTVVTFNANGSINGQIKSNPNRFSTAAALIRGTAAITYKTVGGITGLDTSNANSDGPVSYQVSGFKQAEAQ